MASILNRLGNEAEAEAATRRAIAKGMDDVHSYLLLGRILGKQDRFAEAEAAYRAAVRRDPASPPAQRELAQLVMDADRRPGQGARRTGCRAADP